MNHMSSERSWLRILVGDVRKTIKKIATESVDCVVTSPPYWGLRDYGTAQWEGGDPDCDHRRESRGKASWGPGSTGSSTLAGRPSNDHHSIQPHYKDACGKCGARRVDRQIGMEESPKLYVQTMVRLFREIRRILKPQGTAWLNLGDSYNGSGGVGGAGKQHTNRGSVGRRDRRAGWGGLKQKDLVGIPWRVALALQDDGWWLRSEIIWHKPNGMPESVCDRPTRNHEQVFLLAKSSDYFYDKEAIAEPVKNANTTGANSTLRVDKVPKDRKPNGNESVDEMTMDAMRNKRSVWSIPTAAYSEAHFATFPPKLAETCILAGTSERGVCPSCGAPWVRLIEETKLRRERPNDFTKRTGEDGTGNVCANSVAGVAIRTVGWEPSCDCQVQEGTGSANAYGEEEWRWVAPEPVPATVFDPFGGSGTTAAVARALGRHAVLCELNPEYVDLVPGRVEAVMASYYGRAKLDRVEPLENQMSLF